MTEYIFTVKLFATAHVKAESEAEARSKLDAELEYLDVVFRDEPADIQLGTVSIDPAFKRERAHD